MLATSSLITGVLWDHQAWDDIISNILQVLCNGTDGIAMSRNKTPLRIGLRSARALDLWSATRDLQVNDDIAGSILQVPHDGTDGIAMSRDENSFGIGLRSVWGSKTIGGVTWELQAWHDTISSILKALYHGIDGIAMSWTPTRLQIV